MKNKLALALALLLPGLAYPLESVYVGAEFGQVFLTSGAAAAHTNALGFGGEVGFRTNPVLYVTVRSQLSAHGGGAGTSLWATSLSADVLVGNIYDIEVFLGGGPGFYQFSGTNRSPRFGLQGGLYGDLQVSEAIRLGLGFRFHGLFNPAVDEGSFWNIMMRFGFSL